MQTINTYYEGKAAFDEFIGCHRDILFAEKNTATLVQVFCGQNEPEYVKKLSGEIMAALPAAYIIGVTTFGEIMNGVVSGLKTVISLTVFQQTTIRGCSFPAGGQDELALGRQIAAAFGSKKAKALILFGAGPNVKVDAVLKGIETAKPRLLIAGGSAGNNSATDPALVFYNRDIIDCGFAGVVLEGDCLDARLYSHLGWQMIGKEMTITKAEENRLYTINDIPAYQVYRRYLGIDKDCDFLNAVEFPLILNRDGFYMARTPRNYYEDDSIGLFGEVAEGEKVRLSFGDAGLIYEMIEALCTEIKRENADSIFVYSCESRRGFLQGLSDIETKPLQSIATTAGFFTAREYYHAGNGNHLLNATMTVLVLDERRTPAPKRYDESSYHDKSPSSSAPASGCDSVAARGTGVLKALTHLINTVTAELELANQDLNYISLHDSLTGLYNRTFFDQEMKRLADSDDPIGIIVVDMDGLKLINDNLGHDYGDRMLRLLAKVIAESCRKQDVVARIGGDEFAILARGAAEDELIGICRRIEMNAQKARESADNKLLYVSLGFSCKEKNSAKSLRNTFTDADNAMYQCKFQNKETVRKTIAEKLSHLQRAIIDSRA